MEENTRKLDRFMKWVLGILIVVPLLIGVWWYVGEIEPKVTISRQAPMPNPNARDYFIQAHEALITLGNAHPAGLLWDDSETNQGIKPLPVRQRLLHDVEPADRILHKAFQYPYQEVTIRSEKQYRQKAELEPGLEIYRELARYLTFKARAHADSGDWAGAMKSYLDTIQLGAKMQTHNRWVNTLVGYAVERMGRGNRRWPTWKVVDHLDAHNAKKGITRLSAIISQHPTPSDVLLEEKYCVQLELIEHFRNPRWRRMMDVAILDPWYVNSGGRLPLVIMSKRGIMTRYAHLMNQAIAGEKRPFSTCERSPMPYQRDRMLGNTFDKLRWGYASTSTQNNLLLAALALRAYKEEHDTYPKALMNLVPEYLRAIPDDPFALKGSLIYTTNGKSYVLYSIGPDGKDDGGKPAYNRNSGEPMLDRYSVGDIVGGVNIK